MKDELFLEFLFSLINDETERKIIKLLLEKKDNKEIIEILIKDNRKE